MSTVGAQKRRAMVVALAMAAMAAGGSAEVLARAEVHAQMTIQVERQVGKDTIKGRVDASDRACERRRKVTLIARKPNEIRIHVGNAKTNAKGRWKFIPEPRSDPGSYANEGTRYADPGEYRAKVREKKAGGVTCAAAKSPRTWIG